MLEKIQNTIQKYNMLSPGERVCIGLSGGADSVSLLFSLKELGYRVFAVHVNHNLRGEESKRDEEFCRNICFKAGIELYVESVNVGDFCHDNKLSTEEGARKLRYQAIGKHLNGEKLATAHNLNDCFETTLFNLVRGCGVNGLKGIPPVRDNVIRPLIGVTRAEIEEYLVQHGYDFVNDSTNSHDDCSRNIIRLNVVPELLRINPSLYKTYAKSLNIFEAAGGYISLKADEALKQSQIGESWDFSLISDVAVKTQAIERLLRINGIEPSFDRIDRVNQLLTVGGRINISKGVYVRAESGKISFESGFEPAECVYATFDEPVDYFGKKVEFTEISQFDISSYNKPELKWIIDCDRLCGDACIRGYIGNEKIRLPGRGFTSTVKKLLACLPQRERKRAVVVADSVGAVWVEGFGAAERVACDNATVRAVKVTVHNNI